MLKTKVILKRNLKYLLLIMYNVYCSPEFYKYMIQYICKCIIFNFRFRFYREELRKVGLISHKQN